MLADLYEPTLNHEHTARIRVMVVEDHPMVRAGIRSVLGATEDLEVVAEARSLDEALKVYESERPDVVCLDLVLGEEDGRSLIRGLRKLDPTAKILVVSVRDEKAYAERCLQAGALGYVMKNEPHEKLVEGLRRVQLGEVFVSSRIAMMFLKRAQLPKESQVGLSSLSDRELEVFQLLGLGLSSRQIAARLGIGVKTVETHRDNIRSKLGLPHSAALIREATLWAKNNEV